MRSRAESPSRRAAALFAAGTVGLVIWWSLRPLVPDAGLVRPAPTTAARAPAVAPAARLPEKAPSDSKDPAASSPYTSATLRTLIEQLPFGRDRQAILRAALAGVPAQVIADLLRSTFPDANFNDVNHVLLSRLAGIEPAAALVFAREQRFGIEPPWWHSVIDGLADPRVVLKDVLALPPSDMRASYFGHMAQRLGTTDAEGAIAFALNDVPSADRGAALSNAVFGASRQDHATGFDLALRYAAAAGEPELVKSAALDWSMAEYDAAGARILGLADGEQKQLALAGFIAAAINRDLNRAIDLIAGVRDPAVRGDLYLQAATAFYLRDPARAEAWFATTNELTADEKQYVRDFHRFTNRKN